ncbi:retrovirus-related pol polyprotein from transposon TNT 1-94 [Tanacetum coccineum]
MSVLLDDQMNSVINCLTAKSTWDDLILYHEGPSDVKESRVMDLKLCYNTFKFKEGESITQTFIRYKALMNELVNDGIKLSKLERNIGLINRLPKKWLSFCQSLRNTNHVKDSEHASLFGKLKYEENLIDNSLDDEEDTRSSHEYLNDLEEEYQVRALLAKSKRFFKKGTQRFSSAKATDKTECHKCGKKGHFARDYWSKTSVPSYQSLFQSKLLLSSENKPEPRQTKDFEAKYHKVKAKLALLSSSASASKASMVKNKGLITKAYEWDEEEVSSDENEMVEVKVLMALAEENDVVCKESARNGEWVKIFIRKIHTLLEIEDNDDRKVHLDYLYIDLNYVEEQRSNLLSNHKHLIHELNTCKEQFLVLKQAKLNFLTMQHVNTEILKENKNLISELKELKEITKTWLNSSNTVNQCISEQIFSQKKKILRVDQLTEDPSNSGQKDLVFVKSSADDTKVTIPVSFTESLATDYDSANKSSVYSTPLPPLKKLEGAEPISRPKTIKSILKSKSTLKGEALKGLIINEPSSAPAKGNKSSSASKVHSAPAGKLKSVKIEDDPSLAIVMKELNSLNYKIISLEREINPRNPQHAFERCKACGSSNHNTTVHYDIEWLKRGEALYAKKAEALKSTKLESSNANRSKTPTKSGCSRHMTGVKSYLHKYVGQLGPKVVFGDDSTCITKGYGSIKCNGIVFTKVAFVNGLKYNLISISQLCDAKYIVQFDEKRETIFNSNKEIVMITPRVRDVYVLDMTSSAQESCFFAKASKNIN